jgi:5-methylcytosine-specific restriction endonuclease McrA
MTSAREQADHLARLLRTERAALGDFLVALAVFDRGERWREIGYTSLFHFLRRDLRLSAGAAQNRKTAVELVQRFPEVEPALRDGRLCLSTVTEVAKVLTPENVAEVLPRFFGLSRREAADVAVEIRPVEVIPRREVVTPVRVVEPAPVSEALRLDAPPDPVHPCELDMIQSKSDPPPPPARDEVKPLDAEVSRLHVTVSRAFLAKLAEAKDALSHALPGATTEQILDLALDALIEEKRAKRWGLVKNPRKTPRPSKRDDVFPAHVRRAIHERAQGRCELILPNGERCGETRRLELDHVEPKALGGKSTLENGRLGCRPCNDGAARAIFGNAWMDQFRRKRKPEAEPLASRVAPVPPVPLETS